MMNDLRAVKLEPWYSTLSSERFTRKFMPAFRAKSVLGGVSMVALILCESSAVHMTSLLPT